MRIRACREPASGSVDVPPPLTLRHIVVTLGCSGWTSEKVIALSTTDPAPPVAPYPPPPRAPDATPAPPSRRGRVFGSVEVLCVLLILVGVLHRQVGGLVADAWLRTRLTVFVSVLVQAVPFLVFGVVLSAVIAVFVPRSFWSRALPRRGGWRCRWRGWRGWCCRGMSVGRCAVGVAAVVGMVVW
ncbi:Predicted permease [Micromonospora narathiwatensis]|uniref:Predicted permease n=1 Tax=Micromonospora narathiwatensis TaxID=299146 RepID=A0A1A8ZQA3_9ACTN|nr:Predicted permease [Micromonospora narathiwatensis]